MRYFFLSIQVILAALLLSVADSYDFIKKSHHYAQNSAQSLVDARYEETLKAIGVAFPELKHAVDKRRTQSGYSFTSYTGYFQSATYYDGTGYPTCNGGSELASCM